MSIKDSQIYRCGDDVYADCPDCLGEAEMVNSVIGMKNTHTFYCNACGNEFELNFHLDHVPVVRGEE